MCVLYRIQCTCNCSHLQIKLNEPSEKYAEMKFYISLEIREFLQTSSCETFPESVRVRQIVIRPGGNVSIPRTFSRQKLRIFSTLFTPIFCE